MNPRYFITFFVTNRGKRTAIRTSFRPWFSWSVDGYVRMLQNVLKFCGYAVRGHSTPSPRKGSS